MSTNVEGKGRPTFANVGEVSYRHQAAATLLGVSTNTLRTYCEQSGLEIPRQSTGENNTGPAVRKFSIPLIFDIAAWRRKAGLIKQWEGGPVVVTVFILKGGTGKSTTAVEFATQASLEGYRVLVIDLDVQANATQLLCYEADLEERDAAEWGVDPDLALVKHTFAAFLDPWLEKDAGRIKTASAPAGVIKKPLGENGPHLIPADIFLGDLERALGNAMNRELVLRRFFEASKRGEVSGLNVNDYDIIVLDCPPSTNNLAVNALSAADLVVAPLKMDAFSVKGLSKLTSDLNQICSTFKVNPELVVLPTHYRKSLIRVGQMAARLQPYENHLFEAIDASEEFPRSLGSYLPLTLQRVQLDVVRQYRGFTKKIIEKILARRGQKK